MADYPTIVDGNNDRKIQVAEFVAALTEEHAKLRNPDAEGIAHNLLRGHVSLPEWVAAVLAEDEAKQRSIIETGITAGLQRMKTTLPILEQGLRSGEIPESARGGIDLIRSVANKFDAIDFAGQDLTAIASHLPRLGIQITPPKGQKI